MNKKELIKSLEDLNNRQKPELYNVNDFKVWDKLGKQFTGDIWNDGKYIWKIECYSQLIKDLQPSVIFRLFLHYINSLPNQMLLTLLESLFYF